MLYLYETIVTDEGLKEPARPKNLTLLDLGATLVSNVGLKPLAAFKNLTDLDLSPLDVSQERVQELRRALPKCRITSSDRNQ